GHFAITLTVTDNNGASGLLGATADIGNANPVVSPAANQNATEGTAAAIDLGSFSDVGQNDTPWHVSISWGDSSTDHFDPSTQGSLGSLAHTYADNGSYSVAVTVTDKDGGSGSSSFLVSVANANPVVVAAPNQNAVEGTGTALSLGSFSDLGVYD